MPIGHQRENQCHARWSGFSGKARQPGPLSSGSKVEKDCHSWAATPMPPSPEECLINVLSSSATCHSRQ